VVGQIIEAALPAAGDVAHYSFEGAVGQLVRVHLSVVEGTNTAAQLRLSFAGVELYPGSIPRGRATELSSANEVFLVSAAGTYDLAVEPFGSGPYRLGLGTGAGRLDLSFGSAGTGVVTGPRSSVPADPFLGMQVVGDATFTVGETALSRFDGSGLPDAGFGSGGAVNLPAAIGANGAALRVQPNGMIVVAGRTTTAPFPWVVARFDANGALDPSFGTSGVMQITTLGDRVTSTPVGVRFQQNGADLDIIVAGNGGGLLERIGIVRLKPNGNVDPTFGTGGIVFEDGGFPAAAMDMQPDGKVLVSGTKQLRRYARDGALDGGFGAGGTVTYGITGNVRGIFALPDNRVLAMGDQSGDALLLRLNAAGVPDATFAGGGLALYDFGLPDRFQAATLDASGNLIVVGHQRTTGLDYEFLVTRMSADGVLDESFGVAGYTLELRVDDARAVGVDSQGRIIVGGQERGNVRSINMTRLFPGG
jgi:uncharacterized delta-60 repeat protein